MANQRPPFDTMEGQSLPLARQISVFLQNRVGQLLKLTQVFDQQDVKILGLTVVDAGDCAIVRLVFDKTDAALTVLEEAEIPVSVSEIVVVKLPPGKRGLMTIWSVLLSAEINVAYAYPLLPTETGPTLALYVDSAEIAVDMLQRKGFEVLGEGDLATE